MVNEAHGFENVPTQRMSNSFRHAYKLVDQLATIMLYCQRRLLQPATTNSMQRNNGHASKAFLNFFLLSKQGNQG